MAEVKEKQLPGSLPPITIEGGKVETLKPNKRGLPKKPPITAPSEQPEKQMPGINLDGRAKLAAKIVNLMDAVSNIPKDAVNKGEGWSYLSSDALLRRINPECVKLGLATVIDSELIDWREKSTAQGKIWQICAVKVTITFIDQDTGFSMTTQGIGGGQSSGEKGFASAQTQARKYAFMLALNIDTGDDPEADEKSDAANLVPGEKLGTDGKKVKCQTPGCDGIAVLSRKDEVVGMPVNVYFCQTCHKESRVKA